MANVNIEIHADVGNSTQVTTKGKGKPYCYRCLTKGHVNIECTTVIRCDMCYSDNHVAKACPYQKGAKPTASLCGYAVEGLGFYYIPYAGKQKAQSENKVAMVKVTEGSITVTQVTVELDYLLPSYKGTWTVVEKGKNQFRTTFPSSDELQRMVLWGPVQAKTIQATMEIEESNDTKEYKYEIPKVWIQVRGLSKELREFPIIWAVGSILGVTKMVAVLDPELIPDLVEVVIGDFVYELQFRVEMEENADNPLPINMDIDPKTDKDDGGDGNKDVDPEGPQGKDIPPEMKKGNKSDMSASANTPQSGVGKTVQLTSGISTPKVLLSQTGPDDSWMAEPISGVPHGQKANAYATPTRSSKRSAAASDGDSLEKASKLKARKNLDVSNIFRTSTMWVYL
uniref:CCHC-type domain-containing protein n=1 Tax=Setaria italica TaxID=4555 RepID=K3YN77_SETIT